MKPSCHDVLPATTAAEICARYQPRPAVRALLRSDLGARTFIERLLVDEATQPDVIEFLAHGLPRRLAVWWGCLCVESIQGPTFNACEQSALRAVAEWVLRPDEPRRRAAQKPADALGASRPAGCLALAVLYSGGSMLDPDLPEVEPPDALTASLVNGAVHLAVTASPPQELFAVYRRCIALGLGIGMGRHLWHGRAASSRVA